MNWKQILELTAHLSERNHLIGMQATDQLYLLVTPEAFQELIKMVGQTNATSKRLNQTQTVHATQIMFKETPAHVSCITTHYAEV